MRGKKNLNTREEYMTTSFTICSPHEVIYDQINEDKMGGEGHVAYREEKRNAYRVLVGKTVEKRKLEA